MRLAYAECDEHNTDEDPKIFKEAGTVCAHIVAHDLVAVDSESEQDRSRGT